MYFPPPPDVVVFLVRSVMARVRSEWAVVIAADIRWIASSAMLLLDLVTRLVSGGGFLGPSSPGVATLFCCPTRLWCGQISWLGTALGHQTKIKVSASRRTALPPCVT